MMNAQTLHAKFSHMGARLQLGELTIPRGGRNLPLTLDIRSDTEGEFFDVRLRPNTRLELDVVDLQPEDRHLLLQVHEKNVNHFYLCGHDEAHWFVAAIPKMQASLTMWPRPWRR